MKAKLTPSPRKPASPFIAAVLLGALNVGLVAAAGVWVTGGHEASLERARARVASAEAEHFASEVDAQAAKMATAVMPYAANGPMIAAQAAKLAPEGADYMLAGEIDGRWKVLAATDRAQVGHEPQASLQAILQGRSPGGGFDGTASAGPGTRYTTYYMVPVMPAPKLATPAPTPEPTPRWVKRRIVHQVPEKPRSYVIKAGDTLYQISRDHFGTADQFYEIWEQNKGVIGEDRSKLPVGATIQIPAGNREVIEEKMVLETPAPIVPKATPTPTFIRRMALRLSVPVPAHDLSVPPAPAAPTRRETLTVLAVALGTAGLWLLGGLFLGFRQRRLLAAQRRHLLGVVSDRLVPRAPAPDLASMRSAWSVELVATTLKGPEPPSSMVSVVAFNESQLGLLIGEASGVHPNAAVSRGLAEAFWRSRAVPSESPGSTLLAINTELVDYVPQGDHVTAFYAQLDVMSGALRFAAAAHAGAYLVRQDGEMALLGGRGLPLGVGQELFAGRLEEGATRFAEGERLILFTDALVKAEDPNGEPFGLGRLENCLREGASWSCDRLVARVRQDVTAFVGKRGLSDDAAILCMRLAPRPARQETEAPALPIEQ